MRLHCLFVWFHGADWFSEYHNKPENWTTKEVKIKLKKPDGLEVSLSLPKDSQHPGAWEFGNFRQFEASGPSDKARFLLETTFAENAIEECGIEISKIEEGPGRQ